MSDDVSAFVDPALVVDLAQGMCRIPSPLGGEGPLAAYIAGRLACLGFEVELQPVVPERPNVVAILRGDPAYQSFVINGHLDVAAPVGEWRRDPYDPWVEDDHLFGGGLQDMKGGLAAMIAGAAAIARAGVAPRGDVVVTAVMHHDTTGVGTKYFLESCEWPLDAGVCGEPTNLMIQLGHGGAWVWEITTHGVPRHQSRLEEGVNAIAGMMEILRRLSPDVLTFEPDPRCPFLPRLVVGLIEGGESASRTAATCRARGDVRFLPGMTIDAMKQDLLRVIDAVCAEMPGLSGEVRTVVRQWPYQIAPDSPVVQCLVTAHVNVTGMPPVLTTGLPAGAFITDAADMIRHGIPTAIYGPGDWNTTPNERVPIVDLVTAARVYALLCAGIVTRPRDRRSHELDTGRQ